MRKNNWDTWIFSLSAALLLAVAVSVKFRWFQERYTVGVRWASEGWHWANDHRTIVLAIWAAFIVGFILGWAKQARLADRTIKALARLTAVHKSLETRYFQLSRDHERLIQENAVQQNRESSVPPPPPRPAPAPKPKRALKRKAEPVKAAPVEPRTWQARLLDDDLDHLDESVEAKSVRPGGG